MKVAYFTRRAMLPAIAFAVCLPQLVEGQAPAEPLSLSTAISLALETNPDFLAQQSQLRSAEWNVRSAYGSLMPTANVSSNMNYTATGVRRLDSVILGEQPAMYSSRYNLGMSLSLNGATLLAPSVARAQARATAETVEGAGASLEADVTQRYLSVLESRDAVAQAERELTRTAEYVRLAEARFEVGAGTQLDIRRAEVQRGQAEVRLIQTRNLAANDVLMLGQAIGTSLPVTVELSEQFELFEPGWSADELVGIALSGNPVLRASRAQSEAAATRVRSAQSAYLPTISFSAGLSGFVSQAGSTSPLISQEIQRAQSSFNQCMQQKQIMEAIGLPSAPCIDPTLPDVQQSIHERVIAQNRGFPFDYVRQPASASVTISLPLFTGLNRHQQVEEANIARLNANHQVRAQELRVEVEVESALRNLETAYSSALLQRQVRATAEDELNLAEERFRFGVTTSMEVVDAQASLAEAERAEIAAIYDFHRSLAVLESRLGQPLAR